MAQTYPYKLFNTSDGLINNRTGSISQDSAGYIWIASDNGINNYDGRKFNFFPGKTAPYYFAHTNTINMYKGHCLFGTIGQGVVKCRGNKAVFYNALNAPPDQIISCLFLNDTTYLALKINAKNVEIISGNNIIKLPAPSTLFDRPNLFLATLKDAFNNIWIGTSAGVFVYKNGDFNNPIIIPTFNNKYVNVLKEDFDGNVFISAGNSVYKINKASLTNLETIQPIKFVTHSFAITSLGFLRNGKILVSNYPSGLYIYSKNLNLEKTVIDYGFPDAMLWDIFVDREENIWLATENGVYRFSNFDFINYIPKDAKGSPIIRSGVVYKNAFVFTNGFMFSSIINEKATEIKKIKTEDYNLRAVVTPDNKLWVNNFISIYPNEKMATQEISIEKNEFKKIKTIINNNDVNSCINADMAININKTDMLFMNLNGKLFLYSNSNVQLVELPKNLDSALYTTIGKSPTPNEFVITTKKAEVYYCKLDLINNNPKITILQTIKLPNSFSDAKFKKSIVASTNIMFLGASNKGLIVLHKTNNEFAFAKLLNEPLLSSDFITEIFEDGKGAIWIGSNKGVDKLVINNEAYTISKGMFESQMTGKYIHFIKEFKNRLYIGTTGSLASVSIDAIIDTIIPNVYINHLQVNNLNCDSLLNNNKIKFSYNQNNIAFEFVAPTFINEKQTLYQYILEGVDKDWSTPSSNYEIRYNQLPPGMYTFKVRAKNANGIWSVQDAVFKFIIKAPFYKHWAFLLLCVLCFAALLYWLYKQKMNKVIAVERTRRNISKDLHDDIGSTLSSITLMNAVLKHKIEDKPQDAILMADKIETTSRQMLQNMNDIVWSINPNNDTMEKLIYRLQEFCNNVFEEKKIAYKLTADDALIKKEISMQLRRDIFLTCKEIINNCSKYSKANNFTLKLSYTKKTILIEATDDGLGYNEEIATKGNGVVNIKQRIASHKGKFVLTTKPSVAWYITLPT